MALPKISEPTFNEHVPSTLQEITLRPFRVSEEKILLMANESDDARDIISAIKQVVHNCIETEDLYEDELAVFDYEYLFLKLRSRSVSEVINGQIECSECNANIKVDIKLENAVIDEEGHDRKMIIMLNDEMGMKFKYPSLNKRMISVIGNSNTEGMMDMIVETVDTFFDSEKIYEFTREEMKQFLDDLPTSLFMKVKDIFENLPKLVYSDEVACSECGHKNELKLEGLAGFLEFY